MRLSQADIRPSRADIRPAGADIRLPRADISLSLELSTFMFRNTVFMHKLRLA